MSEFRVFLRGFKEGFQDFGEMIANMINYALLTVVYVVGVGLTLMFAKLVRKHFLNLKKERADSYWVKRDLKKKLLEEYYRQF